MNKLLELLNEYETKTVVHWYEWYGQDVLMCRYIKDNFEFYADEAATIAISKYYGFIKWLVDNDKIDFSLIPNKIKEIGIPMKINGEIKYGFDSSDYYWLLMLLSISDNPIDDLISYLK